MNTTILAGLILFYLLLIALLSYRGYRNTRSSGDYLVAGRSINPFVMAMSYGAAFISTSAIVGFGGIAGLFGMGLLWLPFMNIFFGILVAFLFFGRRTRRIGQELDARTFPDFLGKRFQSPGIRRLAAGIVAFFMPLYVAVVLIGGSRFMEQTMGVDYNIALALFAVVIALYVLIGGIKGVMYVDSLLGAVMVLGMVVLLIFTYHELGGVVEAHRRLSELAPLVPPELQKLGHRGWTAMPEAGSQWAWTLISSLMLGVGIGALAQPQLAVRFMMVKSGKQLNRAILAGAVFILLTAGIAYTVGALSNVWFFRKFGRIAIDLTRSAAAPAGNSDLIIPLFIDKAMPKICVYAFALTMLSAAMSTLSSLLHVNGSSLGYDLYLSSGGKAKYSTGATRIGIAVGLIFSVLLAYLLPPGIVARGTAIFFGICAAAFLPAYVAALYFPRATRTGVWASILAGALASAFGLVFLHRSESASLGVCKAWFGRDVLLSAFPWPYVDTICYALPLAVVVLIVVSWLTDKPARSHLRRCFPINH